MDAPATPSMKLARLLLHEPLDEWVSSRREQKKSWRFIARELAEATGGEVDLAPETLRMWFLEPEEAAS